MTRTVDVELTLVIPCFNEARRINLSAFSEFMVREPLASVIFVDDGSTDGTSALLDHFALAFPSRVTVMTLATNRGKAEAVRAGLVAARRSNAAVVGFWDADLATPLDAVADLLGVLRDNSEVEWVFGSRVRLLGRSINRRATRHYVGRVFATAASLVLALPIYDTQCGAKLFRATPALDGVLADPFRSRWVFDVEMVLRFADARPSGAIPMERVIHEFPLVTWTDVGESKVRALDFLRGFADLARLWRVYQASSRDPRLT
jgi:glycosyltransferase involved in cell wall biosynthesis